MIKIGIDVGGTNTDAVVMEGDRVIASVKAPTSPDVSTGVSEALAGALKESGVAAEAVAQMTGPHERTVEPRKTCERALVAVIQKA